MTHLDTRLPLRADSWGLFHRTRLVIACLKRLANACCNACPYLKSSLGRWPAMASMAIDNSINQPIPPRRGRKVAALPCVSHMWRQLRSARSGNTQDHGIPWLALHAQPELQKPKTCNNGAFYYGLDQYKSHMQVI